MSAYSVTCEKHAEVCSYHVCFFGGVICKHSMVVCPSILYLWKLQKNSTCLGSIKSTEVESSTCYTNTHTGGAFPHYENTCHIIGNMQKHRSAHVTLRVLDFLGMCKKMFKNILTKFCFLSLKTKTGVM